MGMRVTVDTDTLSTGRWVFYAIPCILLSPVQFRNKLAAKTKELSREHTRLVHAKLVEPGYKIKETKFHLESTLEVDHLGFHLNMNPL